MSKINPVLTKVAFPVFSKVQDDAGRLKTGYMKLLGTLTAINAPLLIGLAAVAPWAVPTIFGPKWSKSILLVQLLSLVTLLRSINNPAGSLLYAKGRVGLAFLWHILTLLCIMPVVYVASRVGTVESVALGILLFQVALVVLMYILLIQSLLGKCAREYAQAILKPIALASVMGLAVLALPKLLDTLPVEPLFAFQVILGGLVYLTLVRLFFRDLLV